LWLRIIFEIVLTLLVIFIGSVFWVYSLLPSTFERWIGDDERISTSLEAMRKSGLRFKMSFDEVRKSEEFERILMSGNSNELRVWAIVRWSSFSGVIALLFGSFILHWSYLLINSLAFFLMYVVGLAGVIGVAGKQVAFNAQIIQKWRMMDSAGCEKFCTETNPKFATVFRVANITGGEPAI
jgi:hypothetical protein